MRRPIRHNVDGMLARNMCAWAHDVIKAYASLTDAPYRRSWKHGWHPRKGVIVWKEYYRICRSKYQKQSHIVPCRPWPSQRSRSLLGWCDG